MQAADLLIKAIETLPENRIAEVIDFVEFIKQREVSTTENSDTSWFDRGEECPICAKHRDPQTGDPLYNAETITAIKEVEDMLTGKIPNTLKTFNSLEEMLEDLDSEE